MRIYLPCNGEYSFRSTIDLVISRGDEGAQRVKITFYDKDTLECPEMSPEGQVVTTTGSLEFRITPLGENLYLIRDIHWHEYDGFQVGSAYNWNKPSDFSDEVIYDLSENIILQDAWMGDKYNNFEDMRFSMVLSLYLFYIDPPEVIDWKKWNEHYHNRMMEIYIALAPMDLPPLILSLITMQLPMMHGNHVVKVDNLAIRVQNSIRRLNK